MAAMMQLRVTWYWSKVASEYFVNAASIFSK